MHNYKYLFVISLATVSSFLGCSEKKAPTESDPHNHQASTQKYTCPMHPSVVNDGPGTCPMCGMDLVPVAKSAGDDRTLMLSDSQIKLANITVQKVSKKSIGQSLIINGKLTVDENKTEIVSSRAAGRIERLYIKESGRLVKKGEPLYALYSENLLTLQREYLLALEQVTTLGTAEPRYTSFLKAAERKLLLYGLTKSQLDKLATTKTVNETVTFQSPTTGIVTEVNANEGQYLDEGGTLYKIENINTLWIEAELYPQESSYIKKGDVVNAYITGFDSKPVEARVIFISPEYRTNTQIMLVRAALDNPDMNYKPGMQVQLKLIQSSSETLAIPTDAVIRDSKGTHVYIQTDKNTFEPRRIKTGMEDFNLVQVIEGLKEGEIVAVSGAYLLYSEIILKKGIHPVNN